MYSGGGPLLRGSALGVLTAVLTVTGHGVVGGALPDLAVLAVLLPLLCGLLTAVARRCTGLPALVVTLGAGQPALHLVITFLQPAHDAHAVHETVPGTPMVLAHAVVTLLTAVLVRHADAAVAAVHAAWRRVLPEPSRPPVADRPLRVAAPPVAPARLRPAALAGEGARRGPPKGS